MNFTGYQMDLSHLPLAVGLSLIYAIVNFAFVKISGLTVYPILTWSDAISWILAIFAVLLLIGAYWAATIIQVFAFYKNVMCNMDSFSFLLFYIESNHFKTETVYPYLSLFINKKLPQTKRDIALGFREDSVIRPDSKEVLFELFRYTKTNAG